MEQRLKMTRAAMAWAVFSGILMLLCWKIKFALGALALILWLILIFWQRHEYELKRKEKHINDQKFEELLDTLTKQAVFHMPFPLAVIDEVGKLVWYNTPFITMLGTTSVKEKPLKEVMENFSIYDFQEDLNVTDMNFKGRQYKLYGHRVRTNEATTGHIYVTILYWIDDSAYYELKERHEGEQVACLMMVVDNYEEVKNNTPDTAKPMVTAAIDACINEYFNSHQALVRKYEQDRFLVVIENFYLEEIISRRFDILDEMRELKVGNKIPITLSIGVSDKHLSPLESANEALASVEVALGRGGDQAVLKQGGGYRYFGGKSKAVEKRNKVKARVIADALRGLIDRADRVFIMGHRNADMDAIGSGIGVWRAVQNQGKKGFIVLNKSNPSIDNLMKRMEEDEPELYKHVITGETALLRADENSLLVLVDHHKAGFSEEPKLVDLLNQIVIIDHHRRGSEFVDNPVLVYLEPYASSASELVTEILSYMGEEHHLTKFEAEAMMAGIAVDTKDFSYQTGVRTFEAASALKRAGADMTSVKQLFCDDLETFRIRSSVIQSATIYHDHMAIATLDVGRGDSILIAAQAADELLHVNGILVSFVLAKLTDSIHVSGRSTGEISVQLILEKLGGGGHLTSAGAQLKDMSLDEAKQALMEAIDIYMKEE